eukprot:scaffold252372_cov26-Tisochrysis_lutea.AAC.1
MGSPEYIEYNCYIHITIRQLQKSNRKVGECAYGCGASGPARRKASGGVVKLEGGRSRQAITSSVKSVEIGGCDAWAAGDAHPLRGRA